MSKRKFACEIDKEKYYLGEKRLKFNENNLNKRTMKKAKDIKPCQVCNIKTQYIDYLTGVRYCSEECCNTSMDAMSKWVKGEIDTVL